MDEQYIKRKKKSNKYKLNIITSLKIDSNCESFLWQTHQRFKMKQTSGVSLKDKQKREMKWK